MHSAYRKAVWDQRKSLLVWGSGLALMVFLETALWPSMKSMPRFDEYLADFPTALKELFAMDTMSTGKGFLNAELFTLILPMLMLVYGITRGARMVAGEEEQGTLDLLLVTPLSTTRLLAEVEAALVTGLLTLGSVVFATTVVGSAIFGVGISFQEAAVGAGATTLLGIEFGTVALVAGALSGRHGVAVAVSSGAALAAYVLYVGGVFVGGLERWRGFSPFQQALHDGPLSASIPASFLWVVLIPLALCAVALPTWGRRDIGAGR